MVFWELPNKFEGGLTRYLKIGSFFYLAMDTGVTSDESAAELAGAQEVSTFHRIIAMLRFPLPVEPNTEIKRHQSQAESLLEFVQELRLPTRSVGDYWVN